MLTHVAGNTPEVRRKPARERLEHPALWEHGSDFPWSLAAGRLEAPWTGTSYSLWGSGRDALRGLLGWGRDVQGWQRVLVPTFFCQRVVQALARELPVALYPDAPGEPPVVSVSAGPRDALLVVNTYGMRVPPHLTTRAIVVEDHTHDPLSRWAFASGADYAVASLRKTLPLPDGAVVWSPKGLAVPPERRTTVAHARASFDRLAGMLLKRHYLAGHAVTKHAFRARAVAGERGIGTGEVSGITALARARLPSLPAGEWRAAQLANLAVFRAALGDLPAVRLLNAPFAATLLFDTPELRERVRGGLIRARIYPVVLWPLEDPVLPGVPRRHVELSRRVLCLHCDFRYDEEDMRRVAAAIRSIVIGDDVSGARRRGVPRAGRPA